MKLLRIIFGPCEDVGKRLQFQIGVLVDQFKALADVTGHGFGLHTVLHAKIEVFHFPVLSLRFLGGRAT